MSAITRERLRERAREKVKSLEFSITQAAFADSRSELEEELELARIALASLEAEPVCVIDQANLDYLKSGSDADVWPASRIEMGDVLLYRAAMLQGADGKPELTVWYGAMPESNGKANWTAILHRKGEGRCMNGFTIDRSEYPGRVLYAADRVRYLIGEKSERPSILDYDADAHSGYMKTGNSPVIPDGWVMVPVEPTESMCDIKHLGLDVYTGVATDDYYSIGGEQAAKVWKAMLSKSPKLENRNGY